MNGPGIGEIHTAGSTEAGALAWAQGGNGWRVQAALVANGAIGMAQDVSGPLPARVHPDIARRGDASAVAWGGASGITARQGAAGAWGAPQGLGAGQRPDVAIDARGRAWVAWVHTDGIYLARHEGGWQAMGRIAAATGARTVRITAHGEGVALAWSQPASAVARPRWTVRAALVTTLSMQAIDLDLAASTSAARPALASNGTTLAVAWRREGFVGPTSRDYIDSVQVAVHSGGWSRTQVHNPAVGIHVHEPEVAVGPAGEIALAYSRNSGVDASQVIAVRTRSASSWSGESRLYHSTAGSLPRSSGSIQPRPYYDARGGLVVSWAQSDTWADHITPAVAAQQDDGSWRTMFLAPRTRSGEWASILQSADGQAPIAFWRAHEEPGVFGVRASHYRVPPPASTTPAAPGTIAPPAAVDPTVRTGPVGPILRDQAQRDAADAPRSAARRAALTVRSTRPGAATVTLRPLGRAKAAARRWTVRIPRGVSDIRLDSAGAAAGRYVAEARLAGRIIGRRIVRLQAGVQGAMSRGFGQTGWILADFNIVAIGAGSVTLDLIRSGGASMGFRSSSVDASPDFWGRMGHGLSPSAPLRVTLDIQENTYVSETLRRVAGAQGSALIAGARSLDIEEIQAGQLIELSNACSFGSC